jgi:hypothetical protein
MKRYLHQVQIRPHMILIDKQNKESEELNAFLKTHPINQTDNPAFNSKMKISMEKMHRSADWQYRS